MSLALVVAQVSWLCLAGLMPRATQAAPARQAAPPEVAAKAAIAVDATSGRILYAKNIHRRLPMASTTKIMTALTALSIPGTNLAESYKVVKEDLVGETSMGLRNGEIVTFEDLLYGLMLNSGNDAAMAIARYAGAKLPGEGDPLSRFMTRVNENAAAMGQRNSNYVNPHGFDQQNHFTSPYDLAIAGWYALKHPLLSKIVATQAATRAGHGLNNNNTLLKRYAGANGIKPGYDLEAGLCLVASATREGQTVIAIVLGEETAGYQKDPPLLLDYAFAQLKSPDVQTKIRQGASLAQATDYIGLPDNNRLIPLSLEIGRGSTNANIIGNPFQGAVIQAQITQAQTTTTPGATVTPVTGDGSAAPAGSTRPAASGGINPLTLILGALVIIGLIYLALRFTPLGGERGRDITYRMEDYAAHGLQAGRSGLSKFWGFMRPGPHEETRPGRIPPATPRQQVPSYRQSIQDEDYDDYGDYRDPQSGRSFNDSKPESGANAGYTPGDTRPAAGRSPLESFNDKLLGRDKPEPSAPGQPERADQPVKPLPPQPLTPRRVNDYPVRTAAEPQQTPDSPTAGYRLPPSTRPPGQPPPPAVSNPRPQPPAAGRTGSDPAKKDTFNAGRSNQAGRPASYGLSENLGLRARQAIDYAYAGRLTASTEEFKRVVEQNPLYDFGAIEEFEQMPVLGYKALAAAYREIGKLKFAVLLLENAAERFPSDLDIRNLLRTYKREHGQ